MKPTILKEAATCFRSARRNLIEGARLLNQISREGLWEGTHSTFGGYVEQECQLSQGYASKLITAYQHYVLKGGLSHAKLQDTDPEKLYLAISLTGTPEQQAEKAEMWSRQEIRDELNSNEHGDCKHEEIIKICAKCKKRV